MIQRILTGPARVEWLWVNDFSPNEYHIRHAWPTLVDMWRTSHHNMKHQSSLHRRDIICRIERTGIVELVWLNFMPVPIVKKWQKVRGFICELCVGLKLKINTRSLSNQALKSAYPSLLSSRCRPWGIFSSWLASRDLGSAPSSYLARVWPMLILA